MDMIQKISALGIVPVIKLTNPDNAVPLCRALAMGVFLVLAVLGAAYAGWHSRSWGLGLGVFAVCCAAILVLFWLRSAALTSAFSTFSSI